MPIQKMRVEVFNEVGDKYTITFNGRITKDKAIRLLDLVELLGGMPNTGNDLSWDWRKGNLTKFERLRLVIETHFPLVWFVSNEAQSAYEIEFKEPIRLSTVSTYLSRMVERGILLKNREDNRIRFRSSNEIAKRIGKARFKAFKGNTERN